MANAIRQYTLITANYWAFTLTDGALRMLVVLHFYQLGYSPFAIASLFLFYEFFGVVTNLLGGYMGARLGLNRTMNTGLALQVIALVMLCVPASFLTVPWVMAAQALSGIAKDLNKMSAKASLKLLVNDQQGQLYTWVAALTGSKNALKGVGFFLGGLLLTWLGFTGAVLAMAAALALVFGGSLIFLGADLGKAKNKPKFAELFSKSGAINVLSAARLFLFGARDVWFVVALPVFLASQLHWDFWQVGGFLSAWVIGYGLVQGVAPKITGKQPARTSAVLLASLLTLATAGLALGLGVVSAVSELLIGGLALFGFLFALNSSVHSYLIVSYARADGVSLDVGFYYMANALGRLLGTVLSGWIYQAWGLGACLWTAAVMIALASVISLALPRADRAAATARPPA